MTTQNGTLKIHSPKWKFTHPNEDSTTQAPNDNSNGKLKIQSPKWKFSHPNQDSITQPPNGKLKIQSPKWKFNHLYEYFPILQTTFPNSFLTIFKIKLKIHSPKWNFGKLFYTPRACLFKEMPPWIKPLVICLHVLSKMVLVLIVGGSVDFSICFSPRLALRARLHQAGDIDE